MEGYDDEKMWSRLGVFITVFVFVVGCGGSETTGGDRGDDWSPGDEQTDGGVAGDDTRSGGPDAAVDSGRPDGGGALADTGADTGEPSPETGPSTDSSAVDTDVPGPDGGMDDPDGGDGGDGGMDGQGLTEAAVSKAPWYGIHRVTSNPVVTGNTQEIVFRPDHTVRIGFRGAVTGKWEIFDDDSVRMYDLKDADGNDNRPTQFLLEVELDSEDRLEAMELFAAQGPDGQPYKIRYEQLAGSDVSYSEMTGQWQSKKVFKNHQGTPFRVGVRVEQSGNISYGTVRRGYTEHSRGDGHIITYDTGKTFWFIGVPAQGPPKSPLAGEIERTSGGELVLHAPRAIDRDGKPGAEDFEAVELEPVQRFQLD